MQIHSRESLCLKSACMHSTLPSYKHNAKSLSCFKKKFFLRLYWICHNTTSGFCVFVFWLWGMWDLSSPLPGIKPTLPALEGKVLTTGHQRSPQAAFWSWWHVFSRRQPNLMFICVPLSSCRWAACWRLPSYLSGCATSTEITVSCLAQTGSFYQTGKWSASLIFISTVASPHRKSLRTLP